MTVMHPQSNTELSCNSKAMQTTDHACIDLHSNVIDDGQLFNTPLQEITHNNVKFVFYIYKLHCCINIYQEIYIN